MSFRKREREEGERGGNNKRGGRGRGERGRGGSRGRGEGRGFHSSRRELSQEEIKQLIEESKLNFENLQSFREGTKEEDVGILCYRSPNLPGFSGILKQRYSDFLVNEITPDNEVLRLTQTEVVEPPGAAPDQGAGDEKLIRLVGQETVGKFKAWYDLGAQLRAEKILAKQKRQSDFRAGITPGPKPPQTDSQKDEPFVFDADLEKQARTELHAVLREYPGIATDTVEGGKKAGSGDTTAPRSVRAYFGDSQHFASTKHIWPAKWPPYIKFVMYKENIDTMGAITQICNMMHVNPKNFAFAGTKDKRGVTVQHVSGFKIFPQRLAQVAKAIPCISIGRISFSKNCLKLGELNGNRFTIVLRDCFLRSSSASSSSSSSSSSSACKQMIEKCLVELKLSGFINYFGLQRFGTSTPTNIVGKFLLQEKFDVAFAHLMLPPPFGERPDVTAAREYFMSTRDAQGAFDRFPPWIYVERSLLQGLITNGPNSFVNAFQKLPRTTRSMYGHAYQSHVWNQMTSLRLTLLDPLHAVEGDLILPQSKDVDCLLDEDVGMVDEDALPTSWQLPEPVIVTKQEANEKKYSIWDVVLPLPGHSVQYPTHVIGDKYREVLAADSIDQNSFTGSKLNELRLAGGYRKILAMPKDVEWTFHDYSNPEEKVVPTDRDVLSQVEPTETKGDKLALAVTFSLPPASYATMCVRELLKASTSSMSMTALNESSRSTLQAAEGEDSAGGTEVAELSTGLQVHVNGDASIDHYPESYP